MSDTRMLGAGTGDAGMFVAPENARLKTFSTLTILAGSLYVALTIPQGGTELAMYKYCAFTVLATLAIAFAIEGIGGVRSLIRVDIVALASLYFLTFAEFLHPRVRVLYEQDTGMATFACQLVLIGQCGIAIGRHLRLPARRRVAAAQPVSLPEISPRTLLTVFFLFSFLGYLYVLLVTSFNPVEIFSSLMKQRFDHPWQRGAVGDWRSALTELGLLLYIVAALGGYIYANASQFSFPRRVGVTAVLLFMLLFDFSDGARNVVLIKAGLFIVTFFISSRKSHSIKIIVMSALAITMLWLVSGYMLDARNIGVGQYLQQAQSASADTGNTFMIDNNMVSIARVLQVFPSPYPFPGWDVIIQIFTKWVPRFLWPDKPINWGVSVEEALNTGGGYTLAITYVGEAYLISGIPSLIIVSLLIGAVAAAWTRVGVAARTNMDLIYYASGFFAATLGMRSVQWITIAMVPTVAFYVFGRYVIRRKPRSIYLPQRS